MIPTSINLSFPICVSFLQYLLSVPSVCPLTESLHSHSDFLRIVHNRLHFWVTHHCSLNILWLYKKKIFVLDGIPSKFYYKGAPCKHLQSFHILLLQVLLKTGDRSWSLLFATFFPNSVFLILCSLTAFICCLSFYLNCKTFIIPLFYICCFCRVEV